MTLSIHTENIELNSRLEGYVEKKAGRLDRYLPNIAEVKIDLSQQNASKASHRQVAQITVRDKRGTILRAEERSADIYAAIDGVLGKLYRQINRYRGKRKARRRNVGQADEVFAMGDPLPIEIEAEEAPGRIVRRKQFQMNPMDTDEAIDQMELLGHDFFLFFNVDEGAMNVLYRRKGGNYGLLQPEMG